MLGAFWHNCYPFGSSADPVFRTCWNYRKIVEGLGENGAQMRYEFFKNGQKRRDLYEQGPKSIKSRRKTHLVAIVVRCYVFKLTDYFKYRYRDVFWLNLDLIALEWKQKRCLVIKNAIKFIQGVPHSRFHESGCQKDGQEHEITLHMVIFLAHTKVPNEPTIAFSVERAAA